MAIGLSSTRGPFAARGSKPGGSHLVAWAAVAVLSALMFSGVALSRFSRDESQWIYTARYLSLLAHGQFANSEWDNYWTHTQPPLARYVLGVSLRAARFNLLSLNGPWDFTKEDDENRRLGNWPSPSMLFWARLPIALFAAGAVAAVFLIGRSIAGTWGGVPAAAWLALNPRTRELMTRAESEGLMLCLMLLALWLTIALAARLEASQRRGARWRKPLFLAIALGVVVGLAASAKLTGWVALGAVAVSLLGDATMRWALEGPRRRGQVGLALRLLAAPAACVGIAALALAVFVALNPYTYDGPLPNTLALFGWRQQEMEQQMLAYPGGAVTEPLRRVELSLVRPLFTYGLPAGLLEGLAGKPGRDVGAFVPLDALLVAAGIAGSVWMLVRGVRAYRHDRGSRLWRQLEVRGARRMPPGLGAGGIALTWTAIYFVTIAWNLGLDWDRYYAPLMVFTAIWAGTGVRRVWRRLLLLVYSRRANLYATSPGSSGWERSHS